MNRRKLFARTAQADTFIAENIPSTAKWEFTPKGQHIELGIAEMNLFLLLGAAGLSHSLFGKRLLPIGTVYDPFVGRGLDALNYACYQDARFMIVGTPSGVTLAPEGGAHQSIGSPLIGMSQDGLAAFEPAFVDELAIIMDWAFEYMQRDGEGDPDERTWLRDETGGSVYLRLTTNPLEQPAGAPTTTSVQGTSTAPTGCASRAPTANWLSPIRALSRPRPSRRPAGSASVVATSVFWRSPPLIASMRAGPPRSATADAAIEGPPAMPSTCSHVCRRIAILTVIDGHPATLSWLGAVAGTARFLRRRAFRADRHDRRSLPPFRPRPRFDRAAGARRAANRPGTGGLHRRSELSVNRRGSLDPAAGESKTRD